MKMQLLIAAALAALSQSAQALSYPYPYNPCPEDEIVLLDRMGMPKCKRDRQHPAPLPWPGTIYRPERPYEPLSGKLGKLGASLAQSAAAAFDGGGASADAGVVEASFGAASFMPVLTDPNSPIPGTGKPKPIERPKPEEYLKVGCGESSGCTSDWGKRADDALSGIDRLGDYLRDRNDRKLEEGTRAQKDAERRYPKK